MAGAQSILPALVSRDAQRLERANGRLVGTQVVTQELAGPPAGGFLFSVATWAPFAAGAGRRRIRAAAQRVGGRSFGLRAPFLVAGVVIPVVVLLCLPAINTRTIAEARAAAGLEPRP